MSSLFIAPSSSGPNPRAFEDDTLERLVMGEKEKAQTVTAHSIRMSFFPQVRAWLHIPSYSLITTLILLQKSGKNHFLIVLPSVLGISHRVSLSSQPVHLNRRLSQ